MVTVSISELKAKLSEHIRRVKGGDALLVTDRGKVVAILAPPPLVHAENARLRRLAEKGLIRLGGAIPKEFWALPRPQDPEGSVRKALLEDRAEGW